LVIYLATWLQEDSQGEALNNTKKKERLLSYYLIKESGKNIRDYVLGGNKNEDK
jgi:hypothetical protein